MTETPKKAAPRAKKKAIEPVPGMITPVAPAPPVGAGVASPPSAPSPASPPSPQAAPTPYVPPAAQATQPPPAPTPMLESTARTYSTWAHLGPLLGSFFGIPAFAPALIVWMMGKDKSALVDHHGKESLNFQITIAIASAIAAVPLVIIAILTFGFGLLLLFPIAIVIIVWQVQASMAASRGEYFRYPVSWRLIS